ncbi:MAG TPA: hypothetical protein DD713_10150 [Nitrospiraceae bacterium]|jgi:hypothetical protein|nr:hypothetical protein [Nitrospiraceae bacterium]
MSKIREIKTEQVTRIAHCICDKCGERIRSDFPEIADSEQSTTDMDTINSARCEIIFERSWDDGYGAFISSITEIDLCFRCSEEVKEILRKSGVNIIFPSAYC